MKQPIVAIMYDFDKTLCTKDMQEYAFIPALGMSSSAFWSEVNAMTDAEEMDNILAYMYKMVEKAKEKKVPITRDTFQEMGSKVEYFDGVKTWFERINAYGEKVGVRVEHYIVSSGIKEIIEESRIDTNKNHNYTLMMTIYNIAKIIGSIIEADLLFATNEKLYAQGKCGISFYQGKQINRISSKKIDNIQDVIKELKENATLNLPTVFFCTFEELRTFYFELDEVVYGQDEYQGDQNG